MRSIILRKKDTLARKATLCKNVFASFVNSLLENEKLAPDKILSFWSRQKPTESLKSCLPSLKKKNGEKYIKCIPSP